MSNPGQPLDFSKSQSLGPAPEPTKYTPAGTASNLDFTKSVTLGETDPDPGYQINDVGNKVIVPKEGESFADTMKRAVDHWKSLPPDEQKRQMDAEIATMPEKVPEALTGAAVAGIAGPAALAGAGEAGAAIPRLFTAPVGLTPPIVRAIPHIWRLAKILTVLKISSSTAKTLLDEFGIGGSSK